jgi:excisionase family DNA binding protein
MDHEHALQAAKPAIVNKTDDNSANQIICESRLRSRAEAAEFLRVSVNTVDRLRYQRALPFYRIGGTVRFGPWDLIEFVSGKPVFPEQIILDTQRTLTKPEFAGFLGVSTRTVEHLVQTRGLWRRRVGRADRFLLSDVLIQLGEKFRVEARNSVTSGSTHR